MAGSDNLTPYVKGQSGNPAGKKAGTRNRSTVIREILEAAAAEALKSKTGLDLGVQPQTIFEQLVVAQAIKASLGDTAAFKELADGAYGKLTDKVNNTHSFRKMGKIIAVPIGEKVDATASPEVLASQHQGIALTFDVGEPAAEPENSIEEDLEEGEEEVF